MHMSTISPAAATGALRARAWLALDSDHAGVIDPDSLRGELHELFEGAIVVSEWDDDEPTFDDIEFDD